MEKMENTLLAGRTAGNENTALLKFIALAAMIIDHVGAAFFPAVTDMRVIGRMAFPLYIWCMVVGACYTRNIWWYALRVLVVGAVAQPCYMWGMNHRWPELSIFVTLLLGLLGIAGIREKKWGSQFWAPALALLLSCVLDVDYGWKGVLLILLLYAVRESRGGIAAVMIAFCLYWGQGSSSLTQFFGIPIVARVSFLPEAGTLLSAMGRTQFWAILALPLMLIPIRIRVRLPQWAGYAAYPAHLLIIGIIRHWM